METLFVIALIALAIHNNHKSNHPMSTASTILFKLSQVCFYRAVSHGNHCNWLRARTFLLLSDILLDVKSYVQTM